MLARRLLLVSGKGGTGKSAVAAATAVAAARAGARVLAIALTDPVGLAEHLGAADPGYVPRQVRPGLWIAAVDRAHALDEYLKLQLRVPKAAPTGPIMRALDLLVDTAPGVREIVSIGKPIYEVWREEWDTIVVDAPSLGQLRSYLRAPETIAQLVPEGIVREQAAAIGRTLADPEIAGLVLVTVPAELPVIETRETLRFLHDEPLVDVAGTVVNRILPPLDVDRGALAALHDGPAVEAAELHLSLLDDQAHWRAELPSDVDLPYLFGLSTPVEIAERLADDLEALP